MFIFCLELDVSYKFNSIIIAKQYLKWPQTKVDAASQKIHVKTFINSCQCLMIIIQQNTFLYPALFTVIFKYNLMFFSFVV